ncbi:MAG: glycosyltransferase family 2 protein [Rhodobacteraceae bacterium]|nr:glycosyltransferase family 2 protein [Paracoccaceae bacterium]
MHLLQSTLPPAPDLPASLYLRLTDLLRGGERVAAALAPATALGLALLPGQTLSTDTFYGSFYRACWAAHAGITEVAVEVAIRGQAIVRVFEDGDGGLVQLVRHRLDAPGGGRFLLALPPAGADRRLSGGEHRSRLFVELAALRATEVTAIDFVTSAAPRRQATLSIGLCTFNQEAYLARTLAALAGIAAGCPAIRAVHVVNQGAPFASAAIHPLLAGAKMHAVAQRNLGGAGGFARTLAEELAAAEPASHHLMMDDDIVLDPRMIPRALRFLDYARDDIVLGAGMFDLLRPTVMYEAGAVLRADNVILPCCHNVDLSDPLELRRFNAPVAIDYNAWWFCILPLARCRAAGLPAPLFIRGDDFEYGQRLAREGVATVTLPGIAVHHEPFYAKPQGWQAYYDLRNRLVFAASYPGRVRQLSLAHVTGLVTDAILTHHYAVAELRMRAVRDFLAGPAAVFGRDPEALHGEIMALARAHAPERLEGAAWKAEPPAPHRPRPAGMRRLALAQLASLLRTGFGPLDRGGRTVLIDVDAHPGNTAGRAYVLTNGPRSFHQRLVPGRGRMWRLMARAAVLALAYRRGRAAAGAAFAAAAPAHQTAEAWARRFAPAPAAPASAPAAPAPAP